MSDVTRILDAIQAGQAQAAKELLPLVYDELRRIAAAKMAHEAPGQTLQPAALVHEGPSIPLGWRRQREGTTISGSASSSRCKPGSESLTDL